MIKNFIKELISRFLKKNPKFFKGIQWAAAGTSIVSGVIDAIKNNIQQLPTWVSWLGNENIWLSGIIAWIIARLPNADPNDNK